ncbi:MAG: helix-turn-helix domain-containing protein [Planctomycetes bacterium]|nr:helix-turn-helix domain-containing protein [Planctomycetota bacterium]
MPSCLEGQSMLEELLKKREVIRNRGTASNGSGEIEYATVDDLLPTIASSLCQLPGLLHRLERTMRRFEKPEPSSPASETDPSYTVRQVADLFQVSPTKVYQMTEKGELRSYKVGNLVRIKVSHIREYQDRHTKVMETGTKKKKPRSYDKSEADRVFGGGWAD